MAPVQEGSRSSSGTFSSTTIVGSSARAVADRGRSSSSAISEEVPSLCSRQHELLVALELLRDLDLALADDEEALRLGAASSMITAPLRSVSRP